MAALVRSRSLGDGPAASRKIIETRARHRPGPTGPSLAQPKVLALFSLPLAALVGASSSPSSASSPSVFPYVPTSLLVPSASDTSSSAPQDIRVVYIFAADDNGNVDLLALNVSSTVQASSTISALQTVAQGVPFLPESGQASITTAFTPWLLPDGSIMVLAGGCASDGSSSSAAWTLNPSADSPTWTSTNVSLSSTSNSSAPWFLGGGLAFSSQIAPTVSDPLIYVYGGMCPEVGERDASSSADWQANATYTNQMLRLSNSSDAYSASLVSSKSAPIAEAGFTLTALGPSVANHSSGVVTQQVSGVILGGHTRTAFVNMSTAAVWSLPEEAWSFVAIASDSDSSPTVPDSRSGHTAVLSEDGSMLVVLGGWVGDISQAADPQLALLKIGDSYGDWQWSIPSTQPSGSGIYGHGAALLPGNVMMVYGGYNINSTSSSSSSSRLVRRDSGDSLSFLNLTSLAWTSEYTNPTYSSASAASSTSSSSSPSSSSSSSSSPSSSTSSSVKIGLGLGLGLGLPLIFLVLFFCFRRLWQSYLQRRRRDEAVNTLAQDHNQFLAGHEDMLEVGEQAALPPHWAASYAGGYDPYRAGAGAGNGNGDGNRIGNGIGRQSLGYESLRGSSRQGASIGSEAEMSEKSAYAEEATIATAVIVRKPTRQVARGLYQPTSIADYEHANSIMIGGAGAGYSGGGGGGSSGSGNGNGNGIGSGANGAAGGVGNNIHPIYEADEEEDDESAIDHRNAVQAALLSVGAFHSASSSGRSISPETAEDSSASQSDPFLTPVATSREKFAMPGSGGTPGTGSTGATVQLNPFVRSTPSPDGRSRPGAAIGVGTNTGGAGENSSGVVAGQDRDVQEWVSGLEIEDLLFSPPLPGAGASIAVGGGGSSLVPQQRRHRSPVHQPSHRSRSSNGSPTRSGFFGTAAAAVGGGTSGWGMNGGGGADDEARTTSNLSDRSAFSFLSRAGSSQSRMGRTGTPAAAAASPYIPLARDDIAARGGSSSGMSDTTGLSYNTATSGFYALRAEGPGLLYGTPYGADGGGAEGRLPPDDSSTSMHGAGEDVTTSQPAYAPVPSPSPGEYGGATAVLVPGLLATSYQDGQHAHEDENSGLPGSPSKSRGRRSLLGNFFRMISGGSAATAAAATNAEDRATFSESSTGAQPQLPNVRDRAHATLLRRKQGRFDWEADEMREEETTAVGGLTGRLQSRRVVSMPGVVVRAGSSAGEGSSGGPAALPGRGSSFGGGGGGAAAATASAKVPASGSIGAGRRDGSGQSDDWDVENAVRTRSVQVMFTVPRNEQLRVVNAEVEDDEDDKDDSIVEQPGGLTPPPPPPPPPPTQRQQTKTAADILRAQDLQLRQMHDALAESRRLLAETTLEPWTLVEDEGKSEQVAKEQVAEEQVAEDSSYISTRNVDVSWIDAADPPPPISATFAPPELLQPLQPLRSNPPVFPGAPEVSSKKSSSSLRTPSSKASSSSLSPSGRLTPRTSAHRLARRSAATLSSDPATPSAIKRKPAGFVLDMVDQIESSSSSGGSKPESRSASPAKSVQQAVTDGKGV